MDDLSIPLRDQAEADRVASGVQQVVVPDLPDPEQVDEATGTTPFVAEFSVPCRFLHFGRLELCPICHGSGRVPAVVACRFGDPDTSGWRRGDGTCRGCGALPHKPVPLTATVAHVVRSADVVWYDDSYAAATAGGGPWRHRVTENNHPVDIWMIHESQWSFLADEDGVMPDWLGLIGVGR